MTSLPLTFPQVDATDQPEVSTDQLQAIFAAQQARFDKDRYPSFKTRLANLQKLYDLINQNSEAIENALEQDFVCRSQKETMIAEIIGSLSSIRYLMSNLKRFMKPQKRHTSIWFAPGKSYVQLQPLGVIGVMAPWNYSVHLTIAPIAAALAAGNCVMAKMSELTPNTSGLLKKLISEKFETDELVIIEGEAPVSQAFSRLPFNHLLFTGSTQVGRAIAKAAAENLTPVTLELSGKSPVFIDNSYDVAEAATRTLWGKMFNAGQTCVAPDYVLVHEDKLIEFVRAARIAVKDFFPNGLDCQDYTSVINKGHFNRLKGLIDDAKEKGCEVIELATSVESKNKLAPTLVLNPTSECSIYHEELFGPVLPVYTYTSTTDALKFIDLNNEPLAMYVFTKHKEQAEYFTKQVRSGTAAINEFLVQYLQNDLPFGGVGKSGMGKYHGKEGFEAFSNKQSIFVQRGIGHFTGLKLLYPPYSSLADLMTSLIRKWP